MNPFTVETKFFRNSNNSDITSNSISGAGPGVGNAVGAEDDMRTCDVSIIRSEIKENNVILYRISREALQELTNHGADLTVNTSNPPPNPSVDNDGLKALENLNDLKPELNRSGIVLFINDEDNTVQIKHAENIFDSLVTTSTTADETTDTMPETAPDTAEEADNNTAANDEVADSGVEEDSYWNTAIVILCSSSLNTRVQFLSSLYEKIVEKIVKAGRYELIPSSSASASSESSVSSVSSEVDESDDTEEAADTANSAGSSMDTEETADEIAATETEYDFIIFLIGYLLRCDVFVPSSRNNHSNTDATDSIHGDLTGTTLYLNFSFFYNSNLTYG